MWWMYIMIKLRNKRCSTCIHISFEYEFPTTAIGYPEDSFRFIMHTLRWTSLSCLYLRARVHFRKTFLPWPQSQVGLCMVHIWVICVRESQLENSAVGCWIVNVDTRTSMPRFCVKIGQPMRAPCPAQASGCPTVPRNVIPNTSSTTFAVYQQPTLKTTQITIFEPPSCSQASRVHPQLSNCFTPI